MAVTRRRGNKTTVQQKKNTYELGTIHRRYAAGTLTRWKCPTVTNECPTRVRPKNLSFQETPNGQADPERSDPKNKNAITTLKKKHYRHAAPYVWWAKVNAKIAS